MPATLAAVESIARLGGSVFDALRALDPIPWEPEEATELCARVIMERVAPYDGLSMIGMGASDAYEVRVTGYYQYTAAAPAWNAIVTL